MWSDESTFQLFSIKGRIWLIRLKVSERYKQICLASTLKNGGEMLQYEDDFSNDNWRSNQIRRNDE